MGSHGFIGMTVGRLGWSISVLEIGASRRLRGVCRRHSAVGIGEINGMGRLGCTILYYVVCSCAMIMVGNGVLRLQR